MNEYIKYQRTIRELKEENTHLRDEMANLRKSMKNDKKQVRINEEKLQMEQMHAEQLTKYRQDYDAQIQKLQSRVQELEELNTNLQGFPSASFSNHSNSFISADLLQKSMEEQKELVNFFFILQ